ncbi:MAG: tetratricopeptide repeat protein, partial [Nannocystaceae bacterium]
LAYEGLKRPDDAVVSLKQAARLAPRDLDVQLALASVLLRTGKEKEARPHVEAAAELAPTEPEVLRMVAALHTREGKHAEAVAAYEAILADAPEDAEARLALARTLVRAERAEEALPHLERLAKERPKEAVIFSEWGGVLAKLGRFKGADGALARLDQALALQPNLPSAQVRKIAALAATGQCKPAQAAHKGLVDGGPKAELKAQADEALAPCVKKSK